MPEAKRHTVPSRRLISAGKAVTFGLALIPLGYLCYWAWVGRLGANPVQTMTFLTGDWGLYFLLMTLAVTPLRRLSGWNWLQRFRRMLGLFAFFYVLLHFLVYLVFDQFFDLGSIAADIVKRPYITVGFTAFMLMIPLALTSTNAMMRRLGRRWQQLHRLTYLIGVLAILHYLWLVKADIRSPLSFGTILAILLGYRLWLYWQRQLAVQRFKALDSVMAAQAGSD